MKLYRDKRTGKKLYPVCKWEDNQHKLYNAHDRAYNRAYETGDYDEVEKLDHLIAVFDSYVVNGIVYAPYEDYKQIKDYIGGYDARH
jgi:hypothetical protein|nr:MAG TPA: hypothetical protein [Caudoviricetes sp.]